MCELITLLDETSELTFASKSRVCSCKSTSLFGVDSSGEVLFFISEISLCMESKDCSCFNDCCSAFWLQKPSILRACVREEDWGGEACAYTTRPTYTVRRDCPAREPSCSAFWLQKPSILRACVREEDAGGREAGAPLDLKMPLENGRADERVSRGQASE
jgi:hypothetical protein